LSEAFDAVVERVADPISDPAMLPTYLLGREARRHVKVVLTGEGADELFGGYPTYLGHRLAGLLRYLPASLGAVRMLARRLPASRRNLTLEYLARRFAEHADKPWPQRHRLWFATGAADHVSVDNGARGGPFDHLDLDAADASLGQLLRLDYATYLRDDLLTKLDRATMLSAVEPRAPYLDHTLTRFAWTLPRRQLVRGLTTKWLLKRAARPHVPQRFTARRKRGLSVPIAEWLDRGLRCEVDRLLCPERLRRQELVDPQGVRQLLAEHRSGAANHARPLWTLVYLQRWLEAWCPARAMVS
jgi:asparagine synthase (glutamine-hydrolysing)